MSKELANPINARKPIHCKVGIIIIEHPNGSDIADAVNNFEWPVATLQRVLAGHDILLGLDILSKHRKQQCLCFAPKG